MFQREYMQPNPMQTYILETADGTEYVGRWLVGNTYEGWYLQDEPRGIFSQKELDVVFYSECCNSHEMKHRYIPKKLLDNMFRGRKEIPHLSPEILCYIQEA